MPAEREVGNDKIRIMVKLSKTRLNPSHSGSSEGSGLSSLAASSAETNSSLNLSNHFLIAMPSVLDPIFGGTVVYLCEHNAQGALGLIINKATDMSMESLLDRVDLAMLGSVQDDLKSEVVMFGGPVKMERGFVLHAPHGDYSSMLKVTDQIALTTSRDVLEAVAKGQGPERVMVTLGYAGWSAGQLEQEIASNGWLTVPADPHIVFDLPIGEKFAAAMKLLGIDPMRLTAQAGHA